MDKYSFDKYHKGGSNTPTSQSCSKKDSKTMRYSSSKNKLSQLRDDRLDYSHDECDSHLMSDSNQLAALAINGLQKSMQDVSMHQAPTQSLQWETRQIKILQAATLDHVLKFILLINSSSTSSASSSTSSRDLTNPVNSDSGSSSTGGGSDNTLEEERNNVAHIIHVFFCTFRIHTNLYELMLKLMDYSDICRVEQYRFVMHYWMDNYPEDFEYIVEFPENCEPTNNGAYNKDNSISNASATTTSQSINSHHSNSIASYDSSITTKTVATSDSETNSIGTGNGMTSISGSGRLVGGKPRATTSLSSRSAESDQLNRRLSNLSIRTNTQTPDNKPPGVTLLSELLRLCRDEYIRKKASQLNELRAINSISNSSSSSNIIGLDGETTSRRVKQSGSSTSSKNSAILDLDSRYVAQQLTAIDLDNFLNLRPYSLLEGTRSDKRVQSMVKNFNLLSRHVVITILKSHQPNIVAAHWIAIAMNLRKIKNFNSLKAIIAGLTNESVYRLKQLVWSKLDRTSLANFKLMASIVDDVNNQIVLRQTQLVVEGTAKMSIEDDSFGTIPYLGTFLTDLNMIDARYPSYVPSPKDETSKLKLINFEKCAKQFEILTQVQLLQKNVLASLHAIQRRNHFDEQTTLNRLKLEFNQSRQVFSNKPAIPKVARLFENWFYDSTVASMTDKQW